LRRLVALIDQRDPGLVSHSQLVSEYAGMTARVLGLELARVERVLLAGVGKVTLPDSILAKPEALTPAEWQKVREHPEHGAWLVAAAGLQDVAQWVLCHHERVDGHGYPHGLCREQIALEARILAVADAYEAMTSDRVYRRRLGHQVACEELRRCAGTQFDEQIVDAFLTAGRSRRGDIEARRVAVAARIRRSGLRRRASSPR